MKILIIGGTGLISTSITQQLHERGQDEIVLYNRGQSTADTPHGVAQLHGNRDDYAAFEAQMADAGPFDCVIDMVCYSADAARSLARACKGRTGHLIFCSTVDVYARPVPQFPILADAPTRPFGTDYAGAKSHCEAILTEAAQNGDFPLTILRPAHTYRDRGTLLHSFGGRTTYLDRLRRGKPIAVHGDGMSLWCSCRGEDVARAFVGAAGNSIAFGKNYNVAGEEWFTWNACHRMVAHALNAPEPNLVHIPTDLLSRVAPNRAGICAYNFQHNNVFDNGAALRELGFRYTIPFAEGAKRVVSWLDANGRIENSDADTLEDAVIAVWEQCGAQMQTDTIALDTR